MLYQSPQANRNPLVFHLSRPCSELHSIFRARKHRINNCVHLHAFYLLQSTNSRHFGRIKRYGNPPKLIETRLFCLLPTPSSVLYSIFKVSTHPMNHCVYLGTDYLMKSINSRNRGQIRCHSNTPKLKKTHSFCLIPALCSVLYSVFMVWHKFDQPLCSSRRVLYAAINRLPQFWLDETLWQYPQSNRNFFLIPTPYSVMYSIIKVRKTSDRPLWSSRRVLSAAFNR